VLEWKTAAEKEGLDFKLIDIVHDEVQVEVPSMEIAERLIRIQKESMNRVRDKLDVFCPLAVSSDIGRNWYETH
jgi:DNA polymerase I-like protein with 3'-5' exonuclease and polymerase domains